MLLANFSYGRKSVPLRDPGPSGGMGTRRDDWREGLASGGKGTSKQAADIEKRATLRICRAGWTVRSFLTLFFRSERIL